MPRSIFTKMSILLQQCADTPRLPVDDLVKVIRDQELDAFKVFRRVNDHIEQDYCKPATIRRTLYLLADLGLVAVDPVCTLTSAGEGALADYQRRLGLAVTDHLSRSYGVSLAAVQQAITDIKTRNAAAVPSAEQIFDELQARDAISQPISEQRFATLLNLLGRCGILQWFIKKYYWA